MSKNNLFVVSAIAALMLPSALAAQIRESRILSSIRGFSDGYYNSEDVGELVDSSFSLRDGRLIVVRIEQRSVVPVPNHPLFQESGVFDFPVPYSAITGVDVPGDHHALGQASHLLIAGRTASGVGRVEEWKFDVPAKAMVLVGGADYPGRDFVGVAYDAAQSRLLLLDHVGGEVLSAPWTKSTPLPTTFAVLADSTTTAALSSPDDRMLRFIEPGNGSVAAGSSGMAFIGDFYSDPGPGQFLDESGAAVAVVPGVYFNALDYDTGPQPDQTSAAEGGTTVVVRAKSGDLVTLTDLQDGAIVGSGLVPTGASSVTLNLTAPLKIGNVYEAANAFDPAAIGGSFECVARYGAPGGPGAIVFGARESETDAIIGNDAFYFSMRLTVSPPPPESTEMLGVWMLGAFRAAGVDPLAPDPFGGANPVIVAISILDADGFVFSSGQGSMGFGLPLPNDPGLVGEVLLTQFAALDAGVLRFSEIIGMKLRNVAP